MALHPLVPDRLWVRLSIESRKFTFTCTRSMDDVSDDSLVRGINILIRASTSLPGILCAVTTADRAAQPSPMAVPLASATSCLASPSHRGNLLKYIPFLSGRLAPSTNLGTVTESLEGPLTTRDHRTVLPLWAQTHGGPATACHEQWHGGGRRVPDAPARRDAFLVQEDQWSTLRSPADRCV